MSNTKIEGYRTLTSEEVSLINEAKEISSQRGASLKSCEESRRQTGSRRRTSGG